MTIKPPYYKVLWHKCNRCFTHYTSEAPHLRAYLCNECWNAIPHFTVKKQVVQEKKDEWDWATIALYTLGNLCCLIVIGYYLWLK